uniref:Uncharacterized protein n=1 Tax=viral metagenome TaxID=1070528 RepID=A0A6C0C3M6_9ZZZZ
MKFIGNVVCFFKFFDNIYSCFFSGKVETNFQKWTFIRMSKSEISEIVFSEGIQIFSYAVLWFNGIIAL